MESRGLRNNNPGNIRKNNLKYDGEICPSADDQFKQFKEMAYGYRAIYVILYTYQKKYGLTTIEQFIMRYAPPVENHSGQYIKNVCKWSGHGRLTPLNALTKSDMMPLVAAISRMENGCEADSVALHRGWQLFVEGRI